MNKQTVKKELTWNIKQEGEFQYIEEGEGEILLLLHGLFGALSNWSDVLSYYSQKYKVIIPVLPIYTMPVKEAGVSGLVEVVERFVEMKKLSGFTILGNSLGGHVGLVFTLQNPGMVKRMVLTGSSGLFENTMGGSYPRRGSYDFVKEKVAYTFYDPHVASKELVDEVYGVVNDLSKVQRIVLIARSAQKHNLANELKNIEIPVLLIWGLNDTITPPLVAHEFSRRLPNSELKFVDKCCHAPMMENSARFNQLVSSFLAKHSLN